MPFVFIVVGIGLVVVAIRGTQKEAFSLLQSEFSGPNSFIKWALALFILGGLGYVPVIRPITRALLLLVLLVIFLKNGKGLFAQFNSQIANPSASGGATADNTGVGSMGALAGLSPISPIAAAGTSTNYTQSSNPFGGAASDASNSNTYGSSDPYGGFGNSTTGVNVPIDVFPQN